MNKSQVFPICLALVAIPVLAQEAEQNHPRVKLEEVLVTGEKIERSLMETTTAISVFNGKNIADHGVKKIKLVVLKIRARNKVEVFTRS